MNAATVFAGIPAPIRQASPALVPVSDRPNPIAVSTTSLDHGFAINGYETFCVDPSGHSAVGTGRGIGHN